MLAACAGFIIFLQIFLSKKQNKWLGLILPAAILFLGSFFVLFTMPAGHVLSAFLIIVSIPTIILVAIYCVCRMKIQQKNQLDRKQLDKMNIQDLG